jgi:DNA-binding NarL/FixJ family response regulator
VKTEGVAQIGIVAADPLRSVGLLAILEDMPKLRALALDWDTAFESDELAAMLIDVRLSMSDLIEVIQRLRRERPEMKMIAMGVPLEAAQVQAVIGAGAKGYLAETANEGEIRMAVEVVMDGSVWAPRKVLAQLIDALGVQAVSTADSIANKMTPRGTEVLRLLAEGKSNRDIADALDIDEVTVKAHLGRMLRKTGASNRVELTLRSLDEMGVKLSEAKRK